MSSLKSGILQKTEVPDQSEDIASTNNIAPSIHTSTLDKREIELDNFLTVIRTAKEKADTVSESDVWGL